MKRSWWRTGPPIKHSQPILRLTGGQLLRQLAVLVILVVAWVGSLALFLSWTSGVGSAAVAGVTPTHTASPAPSQTPTEFATNTPIPTPTRPATQVVASPTSTTTATPTPTPTETSVPVDAPTTVAPPDDGTTTAISFQQDVLPIFRQVCGKCHGGEKEEEGLNLLSFASVMQGSLNGAVIVPGDAQNSFLVQQVESGEMPKRGPKLLPRQIKAIVDWVNAGAPDN